MPRTIPDTVLFDLGNTLMFAGSPWEPVLERAYRALAASLHSHGIEVDPATFHHQFEEHLEGYYRERNSRQRETSTLTALASLLELKGLPEPSLDALREALDAMYAITEQNWQLEPDALPTLQMLKRDGYRMAIVSNAGDDQDVQQLVDRFGIRPFFELVLTSAACTWRKPNRAIFECALREMDVRPTQAVMVGDRLEADVLGANALGIYSIWIDRRAEPDQQKYRDAIHPRAVISGLGGLPVLLANLRGSSSNRA
jgi:putative hydrolase of the HAD superfamily